MAHSETDTRRLAVPLLLVIVLVAAATLDGSGNEWTLFIGEL